jgi:hypothetical protein
MPLRDHFHPPLSNKTSWEGFHGAWPTMMVLQLNRHLPDQFVAEPRVHVGAEIEVDIGALEGDEADPPASDASGLAYAPAEPSVAVETELLDASEYEVRVFDLKHNRRLVAAVEIVSPSNKDRPKSRQAFVAKCEALLRKGVSVAIVDLVTEKHFNLYAELLELIDRTDPTFGPEPPAVYAAACRWIPGGRRHILQTWSHALRLGQALPTLPVWLAENFAVPLELEASYEDTCRALRII